MSKSLFVIRFYFSALPFYRASLDTLIAKLPAEYDIDILRRFVEVFLYMADRLDAGVFSNPAASNFAAYSSYSLCSHA